MNGLATSNVFRDGWMRLQNCPEGVLPFKYS